MAFLKRLRNHYLRAILPSHDMAIGTLLLISRIGVNVIIIFVRVQIVVAGGKLLEEAPDLCKEGHVVCFD